MYKVLNMAEVDFLQHLKVCPFKLSSSGTFTGESYRKTDKARFLIHYLIHPEFVCTYCLNTEARRTKQRMSLFMKEKKMNKKLRKTIRLTAISLGALLTIFLLAVTIVVNFIFTPEKLTPVVLNVANQSLNARLQMKSVELTFFSTFPRFGLKVTGLQPLAFTALHFTPEDLDPGLTPQAAAYSGRDSAKECVSACRPETARTGRR